MSAASSLSIEDLVGSPDPAWLWDVARRRIAWGNPAAVTFWGEESLLDLIELDFDPDDPATLKLDRLATGFDEDAPLTAKLEFHLADESRWTVCTCYPSTLDDGRPGLLLTVPDETSEQIAGFSRFGEMVQEAPLPMVLFGTDGLLLHQNIEAERIFGAHLRKGGLTALLPSDDDALPLIARAVRNGTVSKSLRLTTRHGDRLHRITLRRVHDPDTDGQALLGLFRDIGDRRALEKAADAERTKMQAMLDLVSDFQWRLDKDLTLTRVSAGVQAATDARAEVLIGKKWSDLVQNYGLGPSPGLTKALSSTAPWREEELLWPGIDGNVIHLLLSALPLRNSEGGFDGWNGVARVVASPEPAETPAENAVTPAVPTSDPDTLLSSVTDGVLMLDDVGQVIRANAEAEQILDLAQGQPLERSFVAPDQPRVRDYIASLQETGFATAYDNGLEVMTRGDPSRSLLLVIQPLGSDYAGAAFTAALRDITPAKQVEAELRDALSKATSANTQKSDFLASVAHELRTPLNAIIGFSEIMRDEHYGSLGHEKYLTYAGDIHDSGELLLSLINDLLDLSKVEAGKFEPEFEQVDISSIVDTCVNMVKPSAADERISIRAQIDEHLPGLVADKRSLTQILLNLLSNAVKFTRPGGQVSVISSLSKAGDLVVTVQDTGIGMSDEDLSRAFAPFGQARSAVIHGKKGTGLGLPLAKALTEANRGALAIVSSPGEGTIVELTFPSTQVLQD
ncbi:PAS domain-containing sensor histidine kinase [Parvibaculaceae bacterium PLY_AMNH_Bact1]|nr:PAS domain-containing sensor histidine kinase [Parvibaculaceae bacterium PLY_AMNH_Bact1]